jgi:hypothetical protein
LTFVLEDVVGLYAGILQEGFFQAIFCAAARGFGDSLKGTVAIFYLDKNIKEKAVNTSPNRNINTPSRRRDLHRETSKASVREEYVVSNIFVICSATVLRKFS